MTLSLDDLKKLCAAATPGPWNALNLHERLAEIRKLTGET